MLDGTLIWQISDGWWSDIVIYYMGYVVSYQLFSAPFLRYCKRFWFVHVISRWPDTWAIHQCCFIGNNNGTCSQRRAFQWFDDINGCATNDIRPLLLPLIKFVHSASIQAPRTTRSEVRCDHVESIAPRANTIYHSKLTKRNRWPSEVETAIIAKRQDNRATESQEKWRVEKKSTESSWMAGYIYGVGQTTTSKRRMKTKSNLYRTIFDDWITLCRLGVFA